MKSDIEASQASLAEAKEATETHKADLAKLNRALAAAKVRPSIHTRLKLANPSFAPGTTRRGLHKAPGGIGRPDPI